MITEEVKEQTVIGRNEDRGTSTKSHTECVTQIVTKTPLTITKEITSQRDEVLKSKDFTKVEDNLYVKRFDEDMSQRMLFVRFNNNLVTIINRPNNLSLGEVIFESNNVQYLEDFEEYLN